MKRVPSQHIFLNVVTAASCLLVCLGPASGLAKTVHTVSIENMKFSPAEVSVDKGDTILWVNKDLVPHTVTAENGSFDSKSIEPDKTWKIASVKKGKIVYKCSFHPMMKAAFISK